MSERLSVLEGVIMAAEIGRSDSNSLEALEVPFDHAHIRSVFELPEELADLPKPVDERSAKVMRQYFLRQGMDLRVRGSLKDSLGIVVYPNKGTQSKVAVVNHFIEVDFIAPITLANPGKSPELNIKGLHKIVFDTTRRKMGTSEVRAFGTPVVDQPNLGIQLLGDGTEYIGLLMQRTESLGLGLGDLVFTRKGSSIIRQLSRAMVVRTA